MNARRLAVLLLPLPFAATCQQTGETALRLEVTAESAWRLDRYEIVIGGQSRETEAETPLRVVLPDETAGTPLRIDVWGKRGGERIATGDTTATPEKGAEVTARVTLARAACGVSCTKGARSCMGAGTVECEEGADGCTKWSAVKACPADMPDCSNGVCGAGCVDECTDGEARCEGTNSLRLCGQSDLDTCLDWLPAVKCAMGDVCSAGVCRKSCVNECTAGEVKCLGAGLSTCGDANKDGCTEWGPEKPCGTNRTCSMGMCSEECMDECTENVCVGLTWKKCGQFDADPCKELSPGTSCIPADSCILGTCTALSGCGTMVKTCTTPPASTCVDPGTLRTYDTSGMCDAGMCDYGYQDAVCPNCPTCDACAGVVCNMPPSVCFADTGTCKDGSCSYGYANGTMCNDGNLCTDGDVCGTGVCAGTPKPCNTPPPPACQSPTVLRTYSSLGLCTAGVCDYTFSDMTCVGACTGDACTTPPGGGTCAAPFDIPAAGGTFVKTTSGTTSSHTSTCGGSGPEHVYSWTPSASGTATATTCTGTTFDTVIYVRSGSCAAGTEVTCNDTCTGSSGSTMSFSVTAGVTYHLFVDGWGGDIGTYTFTVTPPGGGGGSGTCEAPIVIPAGGGVFSGATSGSGVRNGVCKTAGGPEKVYAWTPSVSGVADLDLCGTAFDTVLYVRGDTCTGSEVACDDDTCASGLQSQISMSVTAGRTYYIFVDGYDSAEYGSYSLTVTP